jgi:molybdate transport system substrate-binding protein
VKITRTAATMSAAVVVALVGSLGVAAAAPARQVVKPAAAKVTGTVVVSAASSLTDVFPVIAAAFEKRFPGTHVTFNFAGSSALVQQVLAGAPVDVLATASESTLQQANAAGRTGTPLLFAKNTMEIAMPKNNPANITQLSDLQRPGVLVGVCAPAVPCGSAANQVFAKNFLNVKPVTQELDVRALLGKVISGDIDAGIVYVTDVKSAGGSVSSVVIPPLQNVFTTYPIATINGAPNPAAAAAFVSYVRYTPSAQGILRAYGFARPW